VIVQDGELLTIDLQEVIERHNKASIRILEND